MSATPMLRSLSAPGARPHTPSPKKLSARDTPFGLFDPHGRHSCAANVGVSSTLTIVRMPFAAADSKERMISGGGRRSPLQTQHARSHSSTSLRMGSSPSSHTARLSFATNSFVRAPQKNTRPLPSPSSSHTRSASTPVNSLRQAQNQTQARQRLSPHQIYISAKDARAPWVSYPRDGVREAISKSFSPLPADIILPFAERASEVSELFLEGANAKLLTLLSRIFPPTSDAPTTDLPASIESAPLVSKLPEDWTFADLRFWLFNVDRVDVADALWIRTLRRAILSHSEVLWERVKAVLGAPFDLDAVAGPPLVSQIMPDEGRVPLTLNTIHPAPNAAGLALQDIVEADGEGEGSRVGQGRDSNAIVGLRLSTSCAEAITSTIPSKTKRSSSPSHSHSPRFPLRSLSQNSIPTISSPLAERRYEHRALDGTSGTSSRCISPSRSSRPTPLFPLTFSGMGLKLR